MDFEDTAEEAAFRCEARAWLQANARPKPFRDHARIASVFEHRSFEEEKMWVTACRDWQRTKFDHGYAAITWPEACGGRGGTAMEEIIFAAEEARFDVATGAFDITLGTIGPTVLVHGEGEQRTHLRRMLSGEEIWCQLFSEPSAGSDLAGLRTRAVRDGAEWVINGQKVWTSGAHYADWGYLLARTDPTVPKHAGITAFLIPLGSPGITVRPLRQMTGGADFNEVFFDDVRVPDVYRLGAQGGGWRVAVTTLMNERFWFAGHRSVHTSLEAVKRLAWQRGIGDDPIVRQRLAQLHVLLEVHRYTSYRALTAISRGTSPGPEGSIGKLAFVRILQVLGEAIMALAGPEGTLDNDWSRFVAGVPGPRLGGGTDEVMRNLIGERVLGLPVEPRSDRRVPFDQLPV